jgi:molecular chaperone IbpA
MRSYDFAPLYRSTVGFDRIANLMDRVLSADVAQPTYPPYNIEKTADDAYRISIAVAGFSARGAERSRSSDGNLHVTARKSGRRDRAQLSAPGHRQPVRSSAALRLADHVRVAGAVHEHGMLHVDLVRETPEALKPRRIEIAQRQAARPQVLEAKAETVN